jgi:hypothetical protein
MACIYSEKRNKTSGLSVKREKETKEKKGI